MWRDDVHVVNHILLRHRIRCFIKDIQEDNVAPNAPEIKKTDGREELFETIRTAVKDANGREENARSVGFVLDADDNPHDRWSAVRNRLRQLRLSPLREVRPDPTQEVKLVVEETMPPDGYFTHVEECDVRVGVWLMPDNQRPGALEEFLADLVPEDDPLLEFAKSSTNEARSRGATFSDAKRSKAVLHTWLAWQKKPGRPYGSAIKAQFFRHDRSAAQSFVAWYRHLFPGRD